MAKYVYYFGDAAAEGNRDQKNLLGGKGANLAEMTNLSLPVPPGFTITTEVCTHYFQHQNTYPSELNEQVSTHIAKLEKSTGLKFGGLESPLLISVRSGARASMPGMMDTILNLGLNDETVVGLAKQSGNERFAQDAYRRFIQMYAGVVLGVSSYRFEQVLEESRRSQKVSVDSELTVESLKKVVSKFKDIVLQESGRAFPQDIQKQLWGAISSVFMSWNCSRAISYRRIHKIPNEWGTAVNIVAMVFGNMGDDSATGVAFTRDPASGDKKFFGEFLPNAQGEDVVAGIRTPLPINKASSNGKDSVTLEKMFPKVYLELVETYQKLEAHYKDMQDIEFTIQRGKLYMLQTRTGKRTPYAAIRIAVDMVREKMISKEEALMRVTPEQVEQLLHPRLDPKAQKNTIAKGLPASPGAASGEVVFSSEEAHAMKRNGRKAILVRHETSPEDIEGMDASQGILTALGGMTSHAAVVARGMGKPCVAGCSAISIDYGKQQFVVGPHTVKRGDIITIDGATGEVILGHVPTINSQVDEYFNDFMQWVDENRDLIIRANADTPHDVRVARQFGAQGVGLCRTEHMFFDENRIQIVREMILAETLAQREQALAKLFPIQRDDFVGIFREMKGLPTTIRLLDPPLHEFLPQIEAEKQTLAKVLKMPIENLELRIRNLKELNPMLGHRGCRLGISYPEIYKMQVRAIMEAAIHLLKEEDIQTEPEIMIPLVAELEELKIVKSHIDEVCKEVKQKHGVEIPYTVGTMIEIPRAALIADELATEAKFFSFGTNDLTQMTLGLSRDDSATFLPHYVELGIFKQDPFVTIDLRGVGELVRLACEKGRGKVKDLKIGICGEQGGDPRTIEFCHKLRFNYVSCSPFRVPVARLAAAQARLRK